MFIRVMISTEQWALLRIHTLKLLNHLEQDILSIHLELPLLESEVG